MNNSVHYIKVNYLHLLVVEKSNIRETGHPLPSLPGLQQTLKLKNRADSYRKFNVEYYKKVDWLFGCEVTNKLFCFACLLSSTN